MCSAALCDCVGFKNTLLRIFTILEDIRESQRVQARTLHSIQQQLSTKTDDTSLPDGIHLPVKSIDEFDDLDAKLQDATLQNALVSSCSPYEKMFYVDLCNMRLSFYVSNLLMLPACLTFLTCNV